MPEGSARARGVRALYLSYDGMCDPLGASQVMPYLLGLAGRGHRISLISFEKPERTAEERTAVRRSCEAAGIDWYPLAYHRWPPVLSTLYDVAAMRRLAARLHRREHFDLVHCRSYVPALVGLALKRRTGVPFVFDMRGFWADERREGGWWKPSNPLHRAVYAFFKKREREFWDEADQLVSLTEAARKEITAQDADAAPIDVIPCCVDFGLFRPATSEARRAAREQLGIPPEARVLAYLGSLGGNYMLSEMMDFFRRYRQRHAGARFLFVTHAHEQEIRSVAEAKAVPGDAIIVRSATRSEVPQLLAAADAGIAYKQPSYSAKACSPTKLGEMLALEIPAIVNAGVGDVDRIMAEAGAGAVVSGFNAAAYDQALDKLDSLAPDIERWRTAAGRWFDLETGVERYDAIYRRLANASVGSRQRLR